MRSKKSLLLFIFTYLFLNAGEVDSLYSVEKIITDSSNIINRNLNEEINKVLEELPENLQSKECQTIALHIIRKLGAKKYLFFTAGSLHTSFELLLLDNPEIAREPTIDTPSSIYLEESIYAPGLKLYGVLRTTLKPTININGIYLGTDKLGHFLASGYEYYWKYIETIESKYSVETAQFKAINRGFWFEKGILGTQSLGIFSYADLEANYQGFLFTRNLCDEHILQNTSRNWEMSKNIDIRPYINPNWDETYNPNYYTSSSYDKIQKNMNHLDICEQTNWQSLSTRYTIYEKSYNSLMVDNEWLDTSLSTSLIKLLQASPRKQIILYDNMVKKYHIIWSLKEIIDFFGTEWRDMKPVSFKSFCISP